MKNETVNKNSWHYRLATTYGNASKYDLRTGDYDFCSYFWNCVLGVVMLILIITLSTLLSFGLVLLPLIYVAASIFEIGLHQPPGETAIFICTDIVGLITFGTFWANEKGLLNSYKERRAEKAKEKEQVPPSFAALAYRKFKEKTCIRLKSV